MTSESTHTSNDKYSVAPHSTLEPVLPGLVPHHYSQNPLPAQYTADEAATIDPKQRRNPWGLSPLSYGLLVAAITAVVVGGAVGGGVGGALSSDSSDSQSASTVTITATTTAGATAISSASTVLPSASSLTNYLVAEPYYVDSLSATCDSSTESLSGFTDRYDVSCGTDYSSGDESAEDPSLSFRDIGSLFAYSLLDCIYACDGSNRFLGSRGSNLGFKCEALTWRSDMAAMNDTEHANCFLKNGTGTTSNQCNSCIGAIRRVG